MNFIAVKQTILAAGWHYAGTCFCGSSGEWFKHKDKPQLELKVTKRGNWFKVVNEKKETTYNYNQIGSVLKTL